MSDGQVDHRDPVQRANYLEAVRSYQYDESDMDFFDEIITGMDPEILASKLTPLFTATPVYTALEAFFSEASPTYIARKLFDSQEEDGYGVEFISPVLIGLDNGDFITSLVPVIEESIIFFATKLGPYCYQRWCEMEVEKGRWGGDDLRPALAAGPIPESNYWQSLTYFRKDERLNSEPYIQQRFLLPGETNCNLKGRWRRHLVRENLTSLIERSMKSYMGKLQMMMELGRGPDELDFVCFIQRRLILSFWCSDRFRSERTECLILKHLDEDTVAHKQVVDGVNAATFIRYYEEKFGKKGVIVCDTKTNAYLWQRDNKLHYGELQREYLALTKRYNELLDAGYGHLSSLEAYFVTRRESF
ncbi:hypothetical protein BJ508DRAFT_332497 [Ascobolus immersus RN42]|uniref:Uncharacterized protein n=1 Tax=Ascobolus immersus RN42 TaxID=1160509 RepID=A0A3N4HSQ3_ASCIM|nr:hypothetical protein BJ508DRAFT_332497 [Ascobolus immersus RN42]